MMTQIRRLFMGLWLVALMTGCLGVTPANSPTEAVQAAKDGVIAGLTTKGFATVLASSTHPVLVQLTAPWCHYCRELRPETWRLARKLKGRMLVAMVDVEEEPELYKQFKTPRLPTFIVYDGGKERMRLTGYESFKKMEELALANKGSWDMRLTYAGGTKSRAKIFLIAGSSEGASFGQEVVEQRRYWLGMGFKREDIACFYAIPTFPQYFEDRAQFDRLRTDLQDCQPASMQTIRARVTESAKTPHDFLYVYVTSHGIDRRSARGYQSKLLSALQEETKSKTKYKSCELFNDFQLILDQLPGNSGTSTDFWEICAAKRPDDMIMTPAFLRSALATWPEGTPKYVVLQGCHSGGFLADSEAGHEREKLGGIPNITVLTASRHDRVSFGCNVDGDMTNYGTVYLEKLRSLRLVPGAIDWQRLHAEVAEGVAGREAAIGIKAPERSLPQFFSNSERNAFHIRR